MANIRLEAHAYISHPKFSGGALSLSASASSVSATYSPSSIKIIAEAQDSEVDIIADPVITDVVYRASYEPLQHEIKMLYDYLPITVFTDTISVDDVFSRVVSYNPGLTDSYVVNDTPAFTSTKPFADSVTLSDPLFSVAVTKPFTDSVTLGDVFSSQVGYVRSFTDSVTLSDALFSVAVTKPIDTDLSTTQIDSDPVVLSDTPAFTFTRDPFTDSTAVSQNIILQPQKNVVDSTSMSDNTFEIGATFGGDGGLFNSGTLVGFSPPLNEEFALQFFSN